MALRPLLTAAERGQILAMPTGTEDLAAHYTLSDADMSLIRQRRGEANRLGFAARGGPPPGRQSRCIAAGSYNGGIASLHFPECHPIIGSSGTFREKRENAAPPDLAPSLAHQPSRTCSLTTSALVLRRQKRKALR